MQLFNIFSKLALLFFSFISIHYCEKGIAEWTYSDQALFVSALNDAHADSYCYIKSGQWLRNPNELGLSLCKDREDCSSYILSKHASSSSSVVYKIYFGLREGKADFLPIKLKALNWKSDNMEGLVEMGVDFTDLSRVSNLPLEEQYLKDIPYCLDPSLATCPYGELKSIEDNKESSILVFKFYDLNTRATYFRLAFNMDYYGRIGLNLVWDLAGTYMSVKGFYSNSVTISVPK